MKLFDHSGVSQLNCGKITYELSPGEMFLDIEDTDPEFVKIIKDNAIAVIEQIFDDSIFCIIKEKTFRSLLSKPPLKTKI